jgi:hypothetical protein
MGTERAADRMMAVEDYLLEHGYLAPANIGLMWAA